MGSQVFISSARFVKLLLSCSTRTTSSTVPEKMSLRSAICRIRSIWLPRNWLIGRTLARVLPFFHRYAGGAKAERKASWNGRESFEKDAPYPWFAKTQFTHSQRLTAVMASEKVVSTLPGHATRPAARARTGNRSYNTATTENNPNRQGASRNTVASFHPRVVSSPK